MSRIKYLVIKILLIAAVFCSCAAEVSAVSGAANEASDFTYSNAKSDDEIEITGYNGEGGYVAVPDYMAGQPVTSIGDRAFINNHGISIVFIPDTVTDIGLKAFENNIALSEITLPYSLKTVGNKAFSGCVSLSSVVIPNGTERLGDSSFEDCRSLTNLFLPESINEIGANCFAGCDSLTVYCYNGSYAQKYCENKGVVYDDISKASYNPYEYSMGKLSTAPYIQSRSVSWYIYLLGGIVVIICFLVFVFTKISTAQSKEILSDFGKTNGKQK